MLQISVVIPLFNKENCIERSINSVLSQSYGQFELIIVDDGSTDQSLRIASQFNDPRIKLIKQENLGVSVARNKGVALSSSDYVCFLDADDIWEPFFLEEINALIRKKPEASLFAIRYRVFDEFGCGFLGGLSLKNDFFGECPNFFDTYRKSRSFICSSNVCINKNIFNKIGGFPPGIKVGEDIYVWMRMALLGSVMFSARICSIVYRNSENRTNTRIRYLVPYHIIFFSQNLIWQQDKLASKYKYDVYKFISSNAKIHAASAVFNCDRVLARSYIKYILKKSPLSAINILLVTFLPRKWIEVIKRMRNYFTVSYQKLE